MVRKLRRLIHKTAHKSNDVLKRQWRIPELSTSNSTVVPLLFIVRLSTEETFHSCSWYFYLPTETWEQSYCLALKLNRFSALKIKKTFKLNYRQLLRKDYRRHCLICQ